MSAQIYCYRLRCNRSGQSIGSHVSFLAHILATHCGASVSRQFMAIALRAALSLWYIRGDIGLFPCWRPALSAEPGHPTARAQKSGAGVVRISAGSGRVRPRVRVGGLLKNGSRCVGQPWRSIKPLAPPMPATCDAAITSRPRGKGGAWQARRRLAGQRRSAPGVFYELRVAAARCRGHVRKRR